MKIIEKDFSDIDSYIDCSFELTTKCNFKCIHCYNSNVVNKDLGLKEIEIILHRIKELGVMELFLTGGEIFLRRDISTIIDLCYSLGFKTTLYSNGSCITEYLAKKISQYGMQVEISVYGSNPQVYKRITGAEENYKNTIKSLEILKKHNVSFKTKSIIFKQNYDDFHNLCDVLKYYNGTEKMSDVYNEISCFLFGKDERMKYFRLNNAEVSSILTHSNQYKIHSPKYGFCTALKTQLSIDPCGNVNPCIGWRSVIATNILNDNWRDELSNFTQNFRRELKNVSIKCNECELFEYCIVCPMSFYQDNGVHTDYSEESCRFAKIRKTLDEREKDT